jgi:hypothetical protein
VVSVGCSEHTGRYVLNNMFMRTLQHPFAGVTSFADLVNATISPIAFVTFGSQVSESRPTAISYAGCESADCLLPS